MGKLNELDCFLGAAGNIARPDCPFEPGVEIGGLIIPRSFEFSAVDTGSEAAFLDALIAASIADDSSERLFAVGRYQDNAPSGEAAQDQTFASGLKRRTREATMQDTMTLAEDKIYHSSVKTTLHNKQSRYAYLKVLDQGGGKYAIVGGKRRDVAGLPVLGGFALSTLQVSDYIYPTYSTVGTFTIDRGFSSASDVDSNFAVMLVNFNPLDEITGLQTVELFATSTVTDTIHVTGSISNGTTDLHDLAGADLADIGAWVVTNAEPGDANFGDDITIVSVTESATGYTIVITATGTDPDNPGTGKTVEVSLAAPSVLAALTPPVEGIEGAATTVVLF